MYCLSDFVVVYERSSAEGAIMWLITGICLLLVMEEIKFLQKFLFLFLFKSTMAQEEKLLRAKHLLLDVIWKIGFFPAAVIEIIIY